MAIDEEMNGSVHSDTSLEGNADWDDDIVEAIPKDWIPQVDDADIDKINEHIDNADNDQHILATVDHINIRARSLRRLHRGLEVDSHVVDGYLRLLQGRSTNRYIKCMSTNFFNRLYNPIGIDKNRPADTVNLASVSKDFTGVDLFQTQLIFIPVLVKSHWTLIVVDTVAEQIRYLDSQHGDGTAYLNAVKRWIAKLWNNDKSNHNIPFPADGWRLVPSTAITTPQQQDNTSCGVFILMFAELLATGQDVSRFVHEHVHTARRYITSSLLNRNATYISPTSTNDKGSSPIRRVSLSRHKTIRSTWITEADMTKEMDMENDTDRQGSTTTAPDKDTTQSVDMAIAQCSLLPNGWVTDTIIKSYFDLLNIRSISNETNCTFLSPQFFNLLYNPFTRDMREEYRENIRNHQGQSAADMIRAMHQYDGIFNYARVYIPVSSQQHWGLLEVNMTLRTITYLDSMYTGGEHYAKTMADYLTKFEQELPQHRRDPRQWKLITSVPPSTKHIANNVKMVPRQNNSNDCGVYICLFADLLEGGQDITTITSDCINSARERIGLSINKQQAMGLISDNQLHTGTTSTINLAKQPTRRSTRATRYQRSMKEYTDHEINNELLEIKEWTKIAGKGLFSKTTFHQDDTICVYAGYKENVISKKQLSDKNFNSKYVVQVYDFEKNHYVIADAWDPRAKRCVSNGGYVNDALEKGKWNAEFTVDDHDPYTIVLRATREIHPGEQIFVQYSGKYWCDRQYDVGTLVKAIQAYDIDIDTSTEHTNGNWKKHPKIAQIRAAIAAMATDNNTTIQSSPQEILSNTIQTNNANSLRFPYITADRNRLEDHCHPRYSNGYYHKTDEAGIGTSVSAGTLRRIRGEAGAPDHGMLNDEAVDLYLRALCHSTGGRANYIMTTYTPTIYKTTNSLVGVVNDIHYKLRNQSIHSGQYLFLPLITAGHITLTTVDYNRHTITHEDPKYGGDIRRAHQVREFIEADWDWRIVNNIPMSITRPMWTCIGRPLSETPYQPCGIACGVYACGFATLHTQDIPILHFNSTLVPRMRVHIANSILRYDCTPLQLDTAPIITPTLQSTHSRKPTRTNRKANSYIKRPCVATAITDNTIDLTISPATPPTTIIDDNNEPSTRPSSETTMDITSSPTLPPTEVNNNPTAPSKLTTTETVDTTVTPTQKPTDTTIDTTIIIHHTLQSTTKSHVPHHSAVFSDSDTDETYVTNVSTTALPRYRAGDNSALHRQLLNIGTNDNHPSFQNHTKELSATRITGKRKGVGISAPSPSKMRRLQDQESTSSDARTSASPSRRARRLEDTDITAPDAEAASYKRTATQAGLRHHGRVAKRRTPPDKE
jgi:Ulp1 family protease